MKALLFFAPLLRPHVARFAGTLVLALVTLAAGTALLGVSGWFLTATALTALGVSFNLFAPSAAVRGFSFIRILSRYFEKLVGHNATLRLLSDLRRWLFGALFPRLPLANRSMRHGDLVTRLTADVDALDTVFLLAIGPFIAAIVLGGGVSAVLFTLLPAAGWIYLAAIIVAVVVVPMVLLFTTRQNGKALVEAAATLRANVLDAVIGQDDIVAFGQQDWTSRRFARATAALGSQKTRQALATAIAAGTIQVLTGVSLITIIVFGLDALTAETIEGPILAAIVFGIMGSFEATGVIVRSIGKTGEAIASAERLKDIATGPISIRDPLSPALLPGDDTVRFDAVSFAYPDGARIIDHLDLTLAPGDHVAISGMSGAGKSTLLHLLLRLADPTKGAITIGGTDIRDVCQVELHARLALLSQDSPVFLDTVRANLTLARPGATDAELFAALAKARLTETIRALPLGLDTVIGETGATLSAGQARRLCLARTLLSPATILVLDEPTAGLDRDTELEFFSDLKAALSGRTVVMATHAHLPPELPLRRLELRDGAIDELAS
ncbi:thiol reductant ABC exporter subunit CydC [Pelagibacterium luteolum]|uniref:ATP-binding cassette, subfamily C, CydC n=1 Tax=Pelagibacterium luteolum TaxID=440168 RepID=A0A1G7UZ82_9HYPH|nr:thiol reductant ABC exporter subunit CydC [Pelagibacterium luteolum]SDG52797.1 ATP-binding cassette, subfamily C, CydC [Pelagibacterium luteolum]